MIIRASLLPRRLNGSIARAKDMVLSRKGLLIIAVVLLSIQPLLNLNNLFVQAAPNPSLSLTGSIWENEDGSSPDTVTQLAAGDGTIEAPWGSRINLRAQLKNSSDALSSTNLGLFYDKGDGFWNRVNQSDKKENFGYFPQVTQIAGSTGDDGQHLDIEVDRDNTPWISYHDNGSNDLVVAKYVGSGGSGCEDSSAWDCTTVDSTGNVGLNTSLTIGSNNDPWVSYWDDTSDNLKVAHYVGSGGSGCASSAWDCTTVDNGTDVGEYSGIALKNDGEPWVSYFDDANDTIKLAKYVGTGGSGCAVTSWNCETIDSLGSTSFTPSSIAFDDEGTPWISYAEDADLTNGVDLVVAKYVGSGGTGCNTAAWDCDRIFNGYAGTQSSMVMDFDGNPWVSFIDGQGPNQEALVVARYVSSGGTGCDNGVTDWTCYVVEDDSINDYGVYTSIDIDSKGTVYVAHKESTNDVVRVAKFVGSGGTGCAGGISSWKCTEVGPKGNENGSYAGIAIDNNDDIWIGSYEQTNTLMYAIKMRDWATGGGCDNNAFANAWECVSLDDNKSFGRQSSVAIDPSGIPWVSFRNNNDLDLMIAKYVGQGGTGCEVSSWQCSTIESTGNVGNNTSITFDKAGQPLVSYQDGTSADLKVAYYVGSGGSCDNAAWECDAVDTSSSVDSQTAIVVDDSNSAWVAYHDNTAGALKVAQFVGTGGTGCNDTAWTCTTVENGNDNGEGVDIAIDDTGALWISFMSAGPTPEQEIQVAKYVGSGGSNCVSGAWDCTTIWNYDAVNTTSIAIDPSGTPWIAYKVGGVNNKAYVAKYVGSGGAGCTGGVTSWDCDVIDDGGNDTGQGISLAFDAAGKAWVSYQDETDDTLKVSRYVGSAGTGCGSSVTAWSCNVVDNKAAGATNINSNIVFDSDGKVWISYFDDTNADLVIASLDRSGEILLAPAQRYDNGATISESHADMTSTTDTTNRDDADCIGGGTWNNGKYFSTGSAAGISLPDGSGTAQCTEVVFTLDLSQAETGADYRFILATQDNWDSEKNSWRGLSGGGEIPELTVTDVSTIIGKDNIRGLPNCTDADWGCEVIDSTGDTGKNTSVAYDNEGTAWVSFRDGNGPNLKVARYVGSGGSGCDNTAWDCMSLTLASDGAFTDIAIDSTGSPWVAYTIGPSWDLGVARYVGSGGSGCGNSAWTCYSVDTAGTISTGFKGIAIDKNDNPWISYRDATANDLKVARFVGSDGTGCADAAWSCETVDSTDNVGDSSDIAFSQSGTAWVQYRDVTNETLKVAQYVGSGGSGCSNDAWDCETIMSVGNFGTYGSIAVNGDDHPIVSFYRYLGGDLYVAEYVGSGGTGCTSSVWTCTAVHTAGSIGTDTSIAVDAHGNPWVSYRHVTGAEDLYVARYVGSGGTGCAASSWSCELVDSTNTTGQYTSIAFSPSNVPTVTYQDVTNDDLKIAYLDRPTGPLEPTNNHRMQHKNAGNSFARYLASLGYSTDVGECNGATDYFGSCAFFHASGDYDTITAQANESPYMTYSQRFDSNTELPTIQWEGTTTLAPSTSGDAGDLKIEVYRYGSTNAWEQVASDTTTANCSSANCKLEGVPSGTAADYFETKNGKYWVHFRVYQEPSTSSSITFNTDQLRAVTNEQRARHGGFMQDGYKRPLNWR